MSPNGPTHVEDDSAAILENRLAIIGGKELLTRSKNQKFVMKVGHVIRSEERGM